MVAFFFLLVLIVASGSYFGLKVVRAQRGEPWNASRTFKTNLELIGPHGVAAKGRIGVPAEATREHPSSSRSIRRVSSWRPDHRSVESLQFVLALCAAAACFTTLSAVLGMLPWEIALGTLAAGSLFAAVYMERAPGRLRAGPQRARAEVSFLPEEHVFIDDYDSYAAGGWS